MSTQKIAIVEDDQAIAMMEQELEAYEEVEHFLRFLRNAERGICRTRRDSSE